MEAKWFFKIVLDVTENISTVTDYKAWLIGFESEQPLNRIHDMLSSGENQSGPYSEQNPMFTVDQYISPFSVCVPRLTRVIEVTVLNGQEDAWEETLDALPHLRLSSCYRSADTFPKMTDFFFYLSHPSSSVKLVEFLSKKRLTWAQISSCSCDLLNNVLVDVNCTISTYFWDE